MRVRTGWLASSGVASAVVAAAGLALPAAGQDVTFTWTTCPEFSTGTLAALVCQDPGQLTIAPQATTLPIMWISNAGEDSQSKWNTDTNREIGRYHTWFGPLQAHGAYSGPAPSRTSVDLQGNVYVANREFTNRPASIVKILNEDFIDRNGNGVADTSTDLNNDGVIQPTEMLQHTDLNGNQIVEQNEIGDERVAWVSSVGPGGGLGRCLAIDADGDLWLGLFNTQQFWHVDGQTGAVLGGPYPAGGTPYGAFVDRDGILWAATLGGVMLRFDTNNPAAGGTAIGHGQFGSNYGIASGVDANGDAIVYLGISNNNFWIRYRESTGTFDRPHNVSDAGLGIATDGAGNIHISSWTGNTVYKFDPNGNVLWSVPKQVNFDTRGTVVDARDDQWSVSLGGQRLLKYNGEDGVALGTFATGRDPYTYSDATGLGIRTVFPQGNWTGVYDSGCVLTDWSNVSWTDDAPPGTAVSLRVRSSNDQVVWSPFEDVTNGGPLTTTPNGRYIEVNARLQVLAGNDAPFLFDVTVNGDLPDLAIDIYPNRAPNPVYLGRDYTVYVVAFGSETCDVATLGNVRFGRTGTEAAPVGAPRFRDYNGDDIPDALFGFRSSQCGFQIGSTQGFLTATKDGCTLTGADAVAIDAGRPVGAQQPGPGGKSTDAARP